MNSVVTERRMIKEEVKEEERMNDIVRLESKTLTDKKMFRPSQKRKPNCLPLSAVTYKGSSTSLCQPTSICSCQLFETTSSIWVSIFAHSSSSFFFFLRLLNLSLLSVGGGRVKTFWRIKSKLLSICRRFLETTLLSFGQFKS